MKSNSADISDLAVVILAYSDYESLELSLAVHSKFFPLDVEGNRVKVYILQNGRSTYDCERTYQVAKRYETLWPEDIEVVDNIYQSNPYLSIRELLESEKFNQYKYILKIDDDVFPLTDNWLQSMWECFSQSSKKYGEHLAYVTSLVNNNPWGFKKTIEIMGLETRYFNEIAREHLVGRSPDDPYSPDRICPKDEICTGGFGTIWRYPYIARWLHENTTLQPDLYVQKALQAGGGRYELISGKDRYSINCMLFKKEEWSKIDDRGNSDELMWQKYCIKKNKKIVADLSVPMCHLFFYSQRFENKDLLKAFRKKYTEWLKLPFPISINEDREIENEARLRYIEERLFSVHRNKQRNFLMRSKQILKRKLKEGSFSYRVARYFYRLIS